MNDVHVLGSAGVVAVVPNTALHGYELLAYAPTDLPQAKSPWTTMNKRWHIQSREHKYLIFSNLIRTLFTVSEG